MRKPKDISVELLAAYLEGNTNGNESREVLAALQDNEELQELMRISQEIDDELNLCAADQSYISLSAMAASCGEENYCCLECEKYILDRHGISYSERELMATSLRNKWQEEKGTALHNIGRHLENNGFKVSRKYNSTLNDITQALDNGYDLIAVIDGGEILGNKEAEHIEDIFIGPIPDHSVVITGCEKGHITIYNPDSPNSQDSYPIAQFLDAWADSKNYIVFSQKSSSPR